MVKLKVAVLGATGMVGQWFVSILQNHPWFRPHILAASKNSEGKLYAEAIHNRAFLKFKEEILNKKIYNVNDVKKISAEVDIIFCAINMPKDETKKLEETYARLGCSVISNNSAHRGTPDIPMIIPEVNASHIAVIAAQRRRLGIKRGLIAVKPNCSLQCFVPLIHPLLEFEPKILRVCTYQAVSGAGKTFETFPEIIDNIIPFIAGEEEKTENEPLKIWGKLEKGIIKNAIGPKIIAQCSRVPVTDGHMTAIFAEFAKEIDADEVKKRWENFKGLDLPSSPKKLITYFKEEDRPQTKTERENAMGFCAGRLKQISSNEIKFIGVSHNTVRGAAGGAILLAELLLSARTINGKN
jgi:aspartate-semialdehyde dehydrogenase